MEELDRGRAEKMREYRKGNWTLQETMILIEAKKMDDHRRRSTKTQPQAQPQPPLLHLPHQTTSPLTVVKPPGPVTELRWKWVEDYCWRKGCYRSQNQCNDKWDNLMRDYKKVREYQRNTLGGGEAAADMPVEVEEREAGGSKSYWKMDKGERKDKGLPTNMLPQIYQALYDVVERTTPPPPSPVALQPSAPLPFLPPPPPPVVPLPVATLDPQTSEQSHLDSKRRKKSEEAATSATAHGEGTSGGTTTIAEPPPPPPQPPPPPPSSLQEVGLAIGRIVEAIQASEEREERRHREIMSLHETRLTLEKSRLETHRQSVHGLVDAIHKLATSILTWANSSHNSQGPGPP